MITVVNKKDRRPVAPGAVRFYIGRGSCLGNPFTSIQGRATKAQHVCASRDEAVDKYHDWLSEMIADTDPSSTPAAQVRSMLNKIYFAAKAGHVELECYCAPQKCHGDVIAELINSKLQP
jgi:hypothetical protein